MITNKSHFKYEFCTRSRTASNFTNFTRVDPESSAYEDDDDDADDVEGVLLLGEEFQDSREGTVFEKLFPLRYLSRFMTINIFI